MVAKELMEEYKENMCPFCINYDNKDYQDCKITMQIDGQANCVNYKCKDYCKKRREK